MSKEAIKNSAKFEKVPHIDTLKEPSLQILLKFRLQAKKVS